MSGNKKVQSAGENSTQIQAEMMNVYLGITEERARQIVNERIGELINEFTSEAHEIAQKRVNAFGDELIPRLVKDELLNSLKDPSVQVLLREAQKSAISTERPVDYELLSELLIHRVKKGDNRNVVAGVNQAVRIVDEITDDALLGLTVFYSVGGFIPITGEIEEGLKDLDNLFSKEMYGNLPAGNMWIENLEVLNAVRINVNRLRRFKDYYSQILSGYVDVGIHKGSESYNSAIEMMQKANLPLELLVDHELRADYVRLKIVRRDRLDLPSYTEFVKHEVNGHFILITEAQKEALINVYNLYEKNDRLKQENSNRLMELVDCFDSLKQVHLWWDSIPQAFSVTPVGRVLAYANAQRCDPSLPGFN